MSFLWKNIIFVSEIWYKRIYGCQHYCHKNMCEKEGKRETERERDGKICLTTLAAVVVIDNPQKKKDAKMIYRKTIAPEEL